MKLVVATAWNEAYKPLADITVPLMQRYCEKHGYDLYLGENQYHTDMRDLLTYGDRCKIAIYKSLFDRYDAYCWLDVDCVVMNSDVPVPLSGHVYWSYDINGPTSGFFSALCTWQAHLFLHRSQHRSVEMADDEHKEGRAIQDAMQLVGLVPPCDDYMTYSSAKEAGYCYFDAAYYGWERYKEMVQYEPGDWLVTAPSVPLDQRIEILRDLAARAI